MKPFFERAMLSGVMLWAASAPLLAQATRTWVSGVGDDVNPCSRTAPCKTFAGAISKTAAGGEIDVLDPGGFGTVTITKSMTIDGGSGVVASALGSNVNGIVISAGVGDTIVLRNLQISGAGTTSSTDTRGIKFLSGLKLLVENCAISAMVKRGISIESSTPNAVATVINSSVFNNLNNGIIVSPPTGITNYLVLDHVRAVNNVYYGVGISPGGVVHVRDSVISNNAGGGLLADGSTVEISGTSISGNPIGLASQNSGTIRVGSSTIVENTTSFTMTSGGVIASYGDNYMAGAGVGLSAVSKQ